MQIKANIDEILRKEYYDETPWKAFVFWWLSANGYEYEVQPSLVTFVDGKNDGGIDAVAWPLQTQSQDSVLVVQSKFVKNAPKDEDIRRFRDAVEALEGPLDVFHTWLDTCREELHTTYRRLREMRGRRRYTLLTPTQLPNALKRSLRADDIDVHDSRILTTLERNYNKGRTPRLDELRLKGASSVRQIADAQGTRVYLFTIPVRELGNAFTRHGDILFAGNVRYALRGQTARRVRDGMDETLQNAPHEFVFSHNGVTISGEHICRRGSAIAMRSPSIVNGAQTVSYLGSPRVMKWLHRNPARVIVKFVQANTPQELNAIESKVAFRSNNQNKVDPSDLMIDLPSLVSLQRYFRRHGVHLERKKGEKKVRLGELRIAKERLAQVLAAVESAEGAVKGKRKQELFADRAERLFSQYDTSDKARSEALAWTRVDDASRYAIAQLASKKRRRRAQIGQLATLTVLHRVLRSVGIKNDVLRYMASRNAFDSTIQVFLVKAARAAVSALLQISSKEKKNEPAFYKSVRSVKPAVETASRRSKRRIKSYHQKYLT